MNCIGVLVVDDHQVFADELHLSVNTVRNYVQRVLGKLGVHSKLEAVTEALRLGLVRPPRPTPAIALERRSTEDDAFASSGHALAGRS